VYNHPSLLHQNLYGFRHQRLLSISYLLLANGLCASTLCLYILHAIRAEPVLRFFNPRSAFRTHVVKGVRTVSIITASNVLIFTGIPAEFTSAWLICLFSHRGSHGSHGSHGQIMWGVRYGVSTLGLTNKFQYLTYEFIISIISKECISIIISLSVPLFT
jgi:hypothetical protein